jgi:hypothetical protein
MKDIGNNHIENTVSIVIVQQYLDRCMRIRCRGNLFTDRYLETGVCLSAYCIAAAVLVRFEVSAQQRAYSYTSYHYYYYYNH